MAKSNAKSTKKKQPSSTRRGADRRTRNTLLPKPQSMKQGELTFSPQPEMSLQEAMLHLTRDFDWDAHRRERDRSTPSLKPGHVRIINMATEFIPLANAYGWVHQGLSAALCEGLVEDFFIVSTDEDRISTAEKYATEILRLTDIDDAMYFRRGVWNRELRGEMAYVKQRDHTGHTLHNYLLGWYFFVNCRTITWYFQQALGRRDYKASQYCDSLYKRFGELWCFVSLLHDIGYIFEGELYKNTHEALDNLVSQGASHAKRYFTDVFWKDVDLRRADEKKPRSRWHTLSVT